MDKLHVGCGDIVQHNPLALLSHGVTMVQFAQRGHERPPLVRRLCGERLEPL